jgi:RNA polymerase sigma factor (sigma-70 family)
MSNLQEDINWNVLFVELSKPHWEALLRFCVVLSRDSVLAEDLHQTALLKAVRAFPKFVVNHAPHVSSALDIHTLFSRLEIQAHFKNWLYKIAKNTFLDQKERSRKWDYESEDKIDLFSDTRVLPEEKLSTAQCPHESLGEEQTLFYLQALDDDWKKKFGYLNEKQRTMIFLAAEDYSYKEIAAILEIPIGTVMSSLSRALQKLKRA